MAGKRQHYLPQFLQRGFTSTPGGRKTWLYRKDVAPREVGLRDIGVEENFYNVGSDSSVDVAITDIERDEFVALIEQARTGMAGDVELTNLAPRLITHLEVRSRHLRMTFGESSNRLLKQLLECLQDR